MRRGPDCTVRAGGAVVTVRLIWLTPWDIAKLDSRPEKRDRRLRAWADKYYRLADGDVFLVFVPEPPAAPRVVEIVHDSAPNSPTMGWSAEQKHAAVQEALTRC